MTFQGWSHPTFETPSKDLTKYIAALDLHAPEYHQNDSVSVIYTIYHPQDKIWVMLSSVDSP